MNDDTQQGERDDESTVFPLTLTVEYEAVPGWRVSDPYGVAVIRLNGLAVGREPVNYSPRKVARQDLEAAAAVWLLRVARHAADEAETEVTT